MLEVFVDTDVILDFLLDRKPFSDNASQLFSLSENAEVKLFTSPLIFSNCYYILRKLSNHQKVIQQLTLLNQIIEICDMGKATVIAALESDFKDFEDALQNFSAIQSNIKIIVTRNHKDFTKSQASIMSPDALVQLLIS